jgi:hypothetical protein
MNGAPPLTGSVVDRTALRVNQMTVILVTAVAFALGADTGVWLLLALAVSLAVGAARPAASPLRYLYVRVLRPLRLAEPDLIADDPAPHRFAQGVGAAFLGLSVLALVVGANVAGWLLAWIVVVLAAVNLAIGFCAGCFLYVQLERLGLLGGHGSHATR